MRDFYASSGPMPLDQADGLRRLFAGRRPLRVLPLAANPHVPFGDAVLDGLAQALWQAGRHVLIVDAAATSPSPNELALLDLASAVEGIGPRLDYLAARGLPLAHVDTRGSAASLLDALAAADPACDAIVLHADAADLARMLTRRPRRPLLMAADHPEAVKHAYASLKLLAQRAGLRSFDLVMAADPASPRLAPIACNLSDTADDFVGSVMHDWAVVDPTADLRSTALPALSRVVAAQLADDEAPTLPTMPPPRRGAEALAR